MCKYSPTPTCLKLVSEWKPKPKTLPYTLRKKKIKSAKYKCDLEKNKLTAKYIWLHMDVYTNFIYNCQTLKHLRCPSGNKMKDVCPILCNPMDCSLPGSSVHGILQEKILEWVAVPFCREYCEPRDQTQVFHITGTCFTGWGTMEAQNWGTYWQCNTPQY